MMIGNQFLISVQILFLFIRGNNNMEADNTVGWLSSDLHYITSRILPQLFVAEMNVSIKFWFDIHLTGAVASLLQIFLMFLSLFYLFTRHKSSDKSKLLIFGFQQGWSASGSMQLQSVICQPVYLHF